jgi:hypothetical protein
MSTFGSLAAARAVWLRISEAARERGQPVMLGDYIAEVDLRPSCGFSLEDLGEPDEHLTVWGEPEQLVASVRRIYSAVTDDE